MKNKRRINKILVLILTALLMFSFSINAFSSNTETTSVSGSISWVGDSEDNRPKSVQVVLLQNGVEYSNIEVKAEDNWEYKFDNLPVKDANGTNYVYTVHEDAIDGYVDTYSTNTKNGLAIRFSDETASVSAVYGYISIYYNLDGETYLLGTYAAKELAGKIIEVPSKDFYLNWYGYYNLLKYYGMSIDYIIEKDVEIPANSVKEVLLDTTAINISGTEYPETAHPYTSYKSYLWHYTGLGGSGFDIINIKNTREYIGNIDWIGDTEEVRPETVQINLLQNGEKIEHQVINTENKKYQFDNIPIYNKNTMEMYKYSVIEDIDNNYVVEYNDSDIVNTYKNVTIDIETFWNNEASRYKNNINNIRFNLIGRTYEYNSFGSPTGNYTDTIVDSKITNEESNWAVTFENISRYDNNGNKLDYFIDIESSENIDLAGKNIELPEDTNKKTYSAVVVHAGRDINGSKAWNGDEEEDRPDNIELTLYQNGEIYKKVTTSAEQNWEYDFGNVPDTDEYGNKYIYYIVETPVEGYSSVYSAEGNAVEITLPTELAYMGVDSALAVYYKVGETEVCAALYNSLEEAAGKIVLVPSSEFYIITDVIMEIPFTYEFVTASENAVISMIDTSYEANLDGVYLNELSGSIGMYYPLNTLDDNFTNIHGYKVKTTSVTPSSGLMTVSNVRLLTIPIQVVWENDTEADRPAELNFEVLDDYGYSLLREPFSITANENWFGVGYALWYEPFEIIIPDIEGYTYTLSGDKYGGYTLTYTKESTEPRLYVYVAGVESFTTTDGRIITPSDSNNGKTPETPIKSIKRAYEILSANGGTIYIVDKVTLDNNITIDKTYYEDSNGKINIANGFEVNIKRYAQPSAYQSLTGFNKESNTNVMIQIPSDYSLTIEDITIDGHKNAVTDGTDREITNTGVDALYAMIYNQGNLIIKNGNIINSYNSSTYSDNLVKRNYDEGNGGAIFNSGNLTIHDVEMSNNIAKSCGGAIFSDGILNIEGGLYSNNIAATGGAIYVWDYTEASITGGTFQDNEAKGDAGAIYLSKGEYNVENIIASRNKAKGSGGAIGIGKPNVTVIKNSKIENNEANVGGALCNSSGATFEIINSELKGNKSNNLGGAIANAPSGVTIIKDSIISNSSSNSGGSIYNGGSMTIENTVISNCKAANGGAIYNDSSATLLEIKENTIINDNEATTNGGAVYSVGKLTNLEEITVNGNRAGLNGGGIFIGSGTLNLVNSELYNNTAETSGGAIYNNATINMTSGTVYGNNAINGDGIFQGGELIISNEAKIISSGTDKDVVYLNTNKYITVNGSLTNEEVAEITPNEYTDGRVVVKVNYDEALASSEFSKFKLTPNDNYLLLAGNECVDTIDDKDIIISRKINIIYDKNTTNEVSKLPETQVIVLYKSGYSVTEDLPQQNGYIFKHWASESDGTGDIYNPGDNIEVYSDTTLYAIWEELGNYVCRIVETGVLYETLTEAVNDANTLSGSNTIEMLTNIDFDSTSVLNVSEDLTIIGDYTISRGGYTGNLFKIPAGIKLTISGGITLDGSNNWTIDEDLYNYNLNNMIKVDSPKAYITSQEGGTVSTAAMFNVLGTLEIKDAKIQNIYSEKAGTGVAYLTGADSVLITDDAEITHCASTNNSVVASLNNSSTWYIEGDTNIHDNFSGGNGGMSYVSKSVIYMSSGTIKDNKGNNCNGTVFMMYGDGATLNMTGGTICGNSGTIGPQNGRNAAVYLHNLGTVNMTGGSICHNIGYRRGGIDSYKSNSTLNINRKDQVFIDGKAVNESGEAAYNEDNHPYIGDNISLSGESQYDVGYNVDQTAHWWVTGGIYTQDVDEFCSEGYVCIPYDETGRTDDYIVVPGYRVRYFSVEKDVTVDENTGTEVITYNKTLEKKYIHMLPNDKFWNEMSEKAEYFIAVREDGVAIKTWYTDQEMTDAYDFDNSKLTDNLDLYGEYKVSETFANKYVTSDSENNLTINLESYIEGETVKIITPKPADIVLVIDQSGSMARSIDESNKLTKEFLYTEEAMKNGETPFYYVAYGNSTACGLWCNNGVWYFYDTLKGKTTSWGNDLPDIDTFKAKAKVVSDATWTRFETNGIWQTRYGATYDAINAFLDQLSKEEADHRVAIVGFGREDDSKTELFINGEDTDYLDMTDEIAKNAFKSVKTEFDSIKKSSNALWPNSNWTNAGSGLGIANSIYKNTTYSTEERDRIVVLFSDGEDQKNTNPYQNSYSLKTTYGAHIYTIKAATASPDFLQHMSSNYPDAKTSSNLGEKWYNKYFLDTHNSDELMEAFGSLVNEVSNSSTQLSVQTVVRDTMSNKFKLPDGINASNIKDKIKVYTSDYLSDGTFSTSLVDITNNEDINIRIKTIDGNPSVEVTGFDYEGNYIAIVNGEARGKKLIVKIPIEKVDETDTGIGIITNDPNNSGLYNADTCIKPFDTPSVDLPATVNIIKNTNGPVIDKEYAIGLQYDKHSYIANGNYLQSKSTNETNEITLKHSESFELPKIVIGGKVEISNSDLDSVKIYKIIDGEKVEFNDYTLSNNTVTFIVTSDMEIEIIDNIYTYAYVNGVSGSDLKDGLTADSSVKTLKQAYTNLPAGGTIYVVDTVTIGTSLQELTITKNSYKDTNTEITYNNNVNISIKRYSQPTVMTDNNNTNNIDGFSATSNINSMIVVSAGSKLTVGDIILDGHKNDVTDGPIHLIAKGVTSDAKSSIIKVYGDLVLDECTIQNNKISNVINTTQPPYGSGLAVYGNGTITMESGWIINNEAVDHPKYAKLWSSGAGVYVHDESTFIMNGGVISGNLADDNGAGVRNGHEFIMNGGVICNNIAKNDGGGVYSKETEDTQFIMNGGAIYGNTAGSLGGGIYIEADDTVINTGEIYNNKASNGGGIYIKSGTLTSNIAEIYGNEATNGGGIYVKSTATLTGETNIHDNKASKGGAIYQDGTLYLEENVIVNTNNDIYLPNNRFVYARNLAGSDIVARLTPNTYTNGRTVVRIIPNETYKIASDLISRFTLTPSGKKALRPGDIIIESKNILDTDIIISELFSVTYDTCTDDIVTNVPEDFEVYWCEYAAIENLIPIREFYNFLGYGEGKVTVEYNPGDELIVDSNMVIYLIWELNFGLDAHIYRIVKPSEPRFHTGELGKIVMDTVGYIDYITIEFPYELTSLNSKLNKTIEIQKEGILENESRFVIPLKAENGVYTVYITAYSITGESITVERDLEVISYGSLDNIKTTIR